MVHLHPSTQVRICSARARPFLPAWAGPALPATSKREPSSNPQAEGPLRLGPSDAKMPSSVLRGERPDSRAQMAHSSSAPMGVLSR